MDCPEIEILPGWGRSSGEGHGNPLQLSCLENSMDGGTLRPWGHKELDTTEQLILHKIETLLEEEEF